MVGVNSAYQLLESYAMLQGAFPVLETLSLPDFINERTRLIKVWCDEWEDIGIPRSSAFDYLRGKGSGHQVQLIAAMDRAYNTMMSKTVRGLAQVGKVQSRKLAALNRQARKRIQRALGTLHQSPSADSDKQEVSGDEAPEPRRTEARDALVARAGARIEHAWKELTRCGREALSEGVPGFRWWDSLALAHDAATEEEPMTRLITTNILRAFAPRRSPSARPEAEAEQEEDFEPSVVLQRLLHVVARRQSFLKARRSPLLERQMGRLSGLANIMGLAIEQVNRKIPLMLDRRECSICRAEFDEGVWRPKTWEEHVFEDLRPFVCMVEDCRIPNRTYAARADWKRHVLDAHCDSVWLCPVVGCTRKSGCRPSSFPLPRGLRRHLRAAHPRHLRSGNGQEFPNTTTTTATSAETTTEEDPDVLVDLIRRGERVNISPQMYRCPLCSLRMENLEHYLRHVGDHLENIELLSTL
ncbi:hypothetical protein PG993_012624 [Apiospora rasikravindrae]|uniref:C2H2-type domain-containing protein n=1 Tax=Apiospora rasikravindrae TaxID=990691 RepID=A0ABR1S341_9PEZI